jgi:hypothetical protein
MEKNIILGMAMQASICSLLDISGLVEICLGQQVVAAILFSILYLMKNAQTN